MARARPDADIRFTLLDGYTQLRDVIDAYGYRLSRAGSALPSPEEVAGRWYDAEYLPGLEAIRRADLPRLYESWRSTDGDLFLWVYQLRRDLRAHDDKIDFDAAAQHARGIHLGYTRKRHHLREGRTPLPRRPPDQQMRSSATIGQRQVSGASSPTRLGGDHACPRPDQTVSV